eukprot:TRINITY_DN95333_c0_g1_i1.p1 TRINITY_DN95333_c0_g1~~TRINITY_DN95333_c0_g1_i1.p1  ORF type:complete len:319 (-),score=68.95 TRINITY_DN95333_c0_g1_i1:74-913(-)
MPSIGGATDPSFGLSNLPQEHDDQLKLGFKMIENAYTSKVQALEHELRGLQLSYQQQKEQAAELQRKNSSLEVEIVQGHQKVQQLGEENKELFKQVQQMRRQLVRLEGIKKKVEESIKEEALENGEDSRLYMRDDYLQGATPLTYSSMQGGEFSGLGAMGSNFRPSATAPVAHGQPEAYRPGAGTAASWDAQAAPSAPPPPMLMEPTATGAPIDGKQFFRQARNSLSYEAFNDFLANIKRLNNSQQSREVTLEEARKIFGPEQQHLYQEFEQLLNRHGA